MLPAFQRRPQLPCQRGRSSAVTDLLLPTAFDRDAVYTSCRSGSRWVERKVTQNFLVCLTIQNLFWFTHSSHFTILHNRLLTLATWPIKCFSVLPCYCRDEWYNFTFPLILLKAFVRHLYLDPFPLQSTLARITGMNSKCRSWIAALSACKYLQNKPTLYLIQVLPAPV